jgi:hypothetical protein
MYKKSSTDIYATVTDYFSVIYTIDPIAMNLHTVILKNRVIQETEKCLDEGSRGCRKVCSSTDAIIIIKILWKREKYVLTCLLAYDGIYEANCGITWQVIMLMEI